MRSKEHSWIKHFWRPALAWQYFIVCISDFVIFPLLTMALSYFKGVSYIPWDPLTLKESGFYHIAMMPILGVSAWTRGREKLEEILNRGETKKTTEVSITEETK